MSYKVKTLPKFDKNLKKLAKKYPLLKSEFSALVALLKENPIQGKSLGKNCYKIRISIASKGSGKSGGARVISNIVVSNNIVYLLTIFDKGDKSTISDKELKELLDSIPDSDE